MVDVEELRSEFLNREFATREFTLDAEDLAVVARSSGETRPEYVDRNHPDFQASPAYIASLAAGHHLPLEFPKLGGMPMDGGKAVTRLAPVRPGIELIGRTHLHEIYAKSGRSGRMIFVVTRLEFFDPAGIHVATSDSRMVIRERPDA